MPKNPTNVQRRRRGVSDTYTRTVAVKVSHPQYKAIQRQAERTGETVSTIVRKAVERSFDQEISKQT